MQLELVKSKIHRAVVTSTELHYTGSIGIDALLLEASGILPHEKVQVVNINNGQRIETYVFPLPKGSREISLNGAAARTAVKGDCVIIITYCTLPAEDAVHHQPTFVFVNNENILIEQ